MSKLFLSAILVPAVVCVAAVSALAAAAPKTYTLKSARAAQAVDRVEVLLEVDGHLKVAEAVGGDGSKVPPLKMNAKAALSYHEKSPAVPGTAQAVRRSVRWYDKAEATIRIGDGDVRPVLRDERRLIAVEGTGPKTTLFCPRGMLTREELDLVEPPGNSLLLDQLLPEKAVAVGESWKHPAALLAAICGLEAVGSSDVASTLASVDGGMAKIEMAGRLAGEVTGLATKIEVKGKYSFQIESGRITWFALLIKEDRMPGPIGPGLDVVARVQMKIVPGAESARLTSEALDGLLLEPTAELERLSYAAPDGTWQMSHDRSWVIISEQESSAVLRMVEEGDYVAQCNIAAEAKPNGKSVPKLAAFQEEIRAALGKNFKQFVRASESTGEAGEHEYRVEVAGEVSEVPIRWIYYLLGDPQGRRVVAVFTIQEDMLERFGDADRGLVRSLRLGEAKVAARPKPAPAGK